MMAGKVVLLFVSIVMTEARPYKISEGASKVHQQQLMHQHHLRRSASAEKLLALNQQKLSQMPWDDDDGDDFFYGGQRADNHPSDYSVGQFINSDDDADDSDDDQADASPSEEEDESGDFGEDEVDQSSLLQSQKRASKLHDKMVHKMVRRPHFKIPTKALKKLHSRESIVLNQQKSSQVPWDDDDGDDFFYGGNRADNHPADYSVGQFINADDDSDDSDDDNNANSDDQEADSTDGDFEENEVAESE